VYSSPANSSILVLAYQNSLLYPAVARACATSIEVISIYQYESVVYVPTVTYVEELTRSISSVITFTTIEQRVAEFV